MSLFQRKPGEDAQTTAYDTTGGQTGMGMEIQKE